MDKLKWKALLREDDAAFITKAETGKNYHLIVKRETSVSLKFELYVKTDASPTEKMLLIARGGFIDKERAIDAAERAFFGYNPNKLHQDIDALGL